MSIKVTGKNGTQRFLNKPDIRAAVCLQVAGGGYSAWQTAGAIELQRELETTGRAKYKGVTIELVADAFHHHNVWATTGQAPILCLDYARGFFSVDTIGSIDAPEATLTGSTIKHDFDKGTLIGVGPGITFREEV